MHQLDRAQSRRDTASFLVCLALAVVAILLPAPVGDAVAGVVRRTVLAPLVWLQQRAVEGRTSRARFDAVEAQRDSAALAAQAVGPLHRENADLRMMLGLARRPELTFVPAEILHQPQPTDGFALLLGAGARDGLAPFQPVLTPTGLLGLVRSVDPTTSVAVTWAHPEFRASAVTADGGVSGLVASAHLDDDGLTILELRGVPFRDSVPTGTLVLTSGLGGVYPPGVPIGTVTGLIREQEGWERVYHVRPLANPASALHVLILTAPAGGSMAGVFAADSVAPGAEPTPPRGPPDTAAVP